MTAAGRNPPIHLEGNMKDIKKDVFLKERGEGL